MSDFLGFILGPVIDLLEHRSWKRFFVTLGLMLLVFVAFVVLITVLTP